MIAKVGCGRKPLCCGRHLVPKYTLEGWSRSEKLEYGSVKRFVSSRKQDTFLTTEGRSKILAKFLSIFVMRRSGRRTTAVRRHRIILTSHFNILARWLSLFRLKVPSGCNSIPARPRSGIKNLALCPAPAKRNTKAAWITLSFKSLTASIIDKAFSSPMRRMTFSALVSLKNISKSGRPPDLTLSDFDLALR